MVRRSHGVGLPVTQSPHVHYHIALGAVEPELLSWEGIPQSVSWWCVLVSFPECIDCHVPSYTLVGRGRGGGGGGPVVNTTGLPVTALGSPSRLTQWLRLPPVTCTNHRWSVATLCSFPRPMLTHLANWPDNRAANNRVSSVSHLGVFHSISFHLVSTWV